VIKSFLCNGALGKHFLYNSYFTPGALYLLTSACSYFHFFRPEIKHSGFEAMSIAFCWKNIQNKLLFSILFLGGKVFIHW